MSTDAERWRRVLAQAVAAVCRGESGGEPTEWERRIVAAVHAAAIGSSRPEVYYRATPESVYAVISEIHRLRILPSTGEAALAYVSAYERRDGRGVLRLTLSHRGLCTLARRAGQQVIAQPVGHGDELEVTPSGSVRVVRLDLDHPPVDYEQLRGVLVVVRDAQTGRPIHTGLVPRRLIDARRESSSAGEVGPWEAWPIEMASKTALHYAQARGWYAIDPDLRDDAPPAPPAPEQPAGPESGE